MEEKTQKKKINRNGNAYTFIYATVLVVVVATLLALCATGLKERQRQNIEAETKQQILSTVGISSEADAVHTDFERYISRRYAVKRNGKIDNQTDAFYINLKNELTKPEADQQLPVFVANMPNGATKYILPVRGNGLWGDIWGYVALNDDLNTIFGVVFDHESETPGLGAEIVTEAFRSQFVGKSIFDAQGQFTSVAVVKGGAAPGDAHAVDAISGGTITSNGLQDMLHRGLELYRTYLGNLQRELMPPPPDTTTMSADTLLQVIDMEHIPSQPNSIN